MAYFRQCMLTKGRTSQVAWIPERFAIINKFLIIEDDDGWQVKNVAGRKSGDALQENEREYLNHRKITDI